ncbi:MAG: NAD(P)H-dependent glycerol-3-phosphate dehydrogenase [Rhodothermaceae bacterium]
MNISVIGAGSWGTTLALLLNNNGHSVTLWEYNKEYADSLISERENKTFLPGIKFPDDLKITNSIEEACTNQHMIVLSVPSQFIRSVLKQMKSYNFKDLTFVNVAKGIEKGTLLRMDQVILDELPQLDENKLGILSGPSHAEEVSKKIPTVVTAAAKNEDTAKHIQGAFMTSYFRVYSSTDVVGVELGGALKNIIAIGAGVCDGAKFGDNTKAAIITRGLFEISKLGVALGAKPETFSGLSGMGDLIVTCGSQHSRNRFVGEKLGSGMKLKDIIESMNMVAEGVETCRSAYQLAQKVGIETPIINAVYQALFEDKDPVIATYELMDREMKPEI